MRSTIDIHQTENLYPNPGFCLSFSRGGKDLFEINVFYRPVSEAMDPYVPEKDCLAIVILNERRNRPNGGFTTWMRQSYEIGINVSEDDLRQSLGRAIQRVMQKYLWQKGKTWQQYSRSTGSFQNLITWMTDHFVQRIEDYVEDPWEVPEEVRDYSDAMRIQQGLVPFSILLGGGN